MRAFGKGSAQRLGLIANILAFFNSKVGLFFNDRQKNSFVHSIPIDPGGRMQLVYSAEKWEEPVLFTGGWKKTGYNIEVYRNQSSLLYKTLRNYTLNQSDCSRKKGVRQARTRHFDCLCPSIDIRQRVTSRKPEILRSDRDRDRRTNTKRRPLHPTANTQRSNPNHPNHCMPSRYPYPYGPASYLAKKG